MKVSSIQSYSYCNRLEQRRNTNQALRCEPKTKPVNPTFKECDVFKTVGFIGGTIFCFFAAPALVAMGLAGVGAIAGGIVGTAIDQKIDENNEKKQSKL